jgi:predicted Zn finger-like uncharacterized protein
MIITCEQCHARYLLASLLLGVHGRKVRCGECGHTWFQEPMDETDSADSEPIIAELATDHPEETPEPSFAEMVEAAPEPKPEPEPDPIPDGVRPVGAEAPAKSKKSFSLPLPKWRMGPGDGAAMVALLVLVLLCGVALVVFRHHVVQVWPPATLAYEAVGLSLPLPGEGLIFDRVQARATADGTLTVDGTIINLRARKTAIPRIRATLLDGGNMTGTSWIIPVNETEIGPESTIPFTATFANIPGDAKEVNVRFTLR